MLLKPQLSQAFVDQGHGAFAALDRERHEAYGFRQEIFYQRANRDRQAGKQNRK